VHFIPATFVFNHVRCRHFLKEASSYEQESALYVFSAKVLIGQYTMFMKEILIVVMKRRLES